MNRCPLICKELWPRSLGDMDVTSGRWEVAEPHCTPSCRHHEAISHRPGIAPGSYQGVNSPPHGSGSRGSDAPSGFSHVLSQDLQLRPLSDTKKAPGLLSFGGIFRPLLQSITKFNFP